MFQKCYWFWHFCAASLPIMHPSLAFRWDETIHTIYGSFFCPSIDIIYCTFRVKHVKKRSHQWFHFQDWQADGIFRFSRYFEYCQSDFGDLLFCIHYAQQKIKKFISVPAVGQRSLMSIGYVGLDKLQKEWRIVLLCEASLCPDVEQVHDGPGDVDAATVYTVVNGVTHLCYVRFIRVY